MANSYEHESESDEDCEVYFLKPVNEYNIVDKIKEANKELFAKDEEDVDTEETTEEFMDLAASNNRKVSFAANLEEYEPQSGISTQQLEQELGKESESCSGPSEQTNATVQQKLEVIKEEDTIQSETETNKEMPAEEQENNMNCKQNEPILDDNNAIEEICEEILIMDMENDKTENIEHAGTAAAPSESPDTLQRKMLKQITFDYDDEQDNKSLTNLLISDNENDEDELNILEDPSEFNCNESLLDDTDNDETQPLTGICNDRPSNEYYDDDEEDDKLSIIVASYLPDDDFDCDKASLTSQQCTHQSFRSRKSSFTKRFSLRRKTKTSLNAVASSSQTPNCRSFMPPPEVTDLKLHYKTCCEFKNAQQKLPKYTGYLSEYGLSREQLEEREMKLEQKQRSLLQNTMNTSENDMRKMHDNERAFTTWLKNKMRFPINKTRNMFDVKRPFGVRKSTSVCATLSKPETACASNRIPNTTRYRSISAKFRKS